MLLRDWGGGGGGEFSNQTTDSWIILQRALFHYLCIEKLDGESWGLRILNNKNLIGILKTWNSPKSIKKSLFSTSAEKKKNPKSFEK